jgi:hypothetical protein
VDLWPLWKEILKLKMQKYANFIQFYTNSYKAAVKKESFDNIQAKMGSLFNFSSTVIKLFVKQMNNKKLISQNEFIQWQN